MNKVVEVCLAILVAIFGYLLLNVYSEIDKLKEEFNFQSKLVKELYDYVAEDYELKSR